MQECSNVFATTSEIKAAFAERTVGSMKKIRRLYLENHGHKRFQKLFQFFETLSSRKKYLLDLLTKIVKIFDFPSILYSKPL